MRGGAVRACIPAAARAGRFVDVVTCPDWYYLSWVFLVLCSIYPIILYICLGRSAGYHQIERTLFLKLTVAGNEPVVMMTTGDERENDSRADSDACMQTR